VKKYCRIISLILILNIFSSSLNANVCDDHVSPILTKESATALLDDYAKNLESIPKELNLAVQEGLLQENQLKAYLEVQKKWDKRGKILGKAFQKSGVWRKFLDNPKFFGDYVSNIASGAGTTVICHVPVWRMNPALDTPLLTVDLLSGLITDSELSFTAARNPIYLKELKRRGLIEPGKIEVATQKMNAIFEKVKELSFKRYLRKRKNIEIQSDAITESFIKGSKIPAKYIEETRKHMKGMLSLSYYFALAGATNGLAYKGLQSAMEKIGYELADPYVGFSMMSEASFFAQFSVHAYTRIVLTDKIVGKTRSMIDDYFEGLKMNYMQNPGGLIDPARVEMYNTLKNFFLAATSIGIFFASNLWATDVYMRWRESGFDNSILLFPYQKEFKQYLEQYQTDLESTANDQKAIESEIHEELKQMPEYDWLKRQEVIAE
jgi:hypothetical protein